MAYSIDIINTICTDLGGTGGHAYEIDGLNEICTLIGATTGHVYNIDALNAICTALGYTAGHVYNIDALNAIVVGGSYAYEDEAWADIQTGSLLNYIKSLNPVFFIEDLTDVVGGKFVDKSGNNKIISAATKNIANDSLIMPANDTDIIAALTAAGLYSIFYTNDAAPKTVIINTIDTTNDYIFKNSLSIVLFPTAELEPKTNRILNQLFPSYSLPVDLLYSQSWTSGFSVNWLTGNTMANPNYFISDFIPVKYNEAYLQKHNLAHEGFHYAWYTSAKLFISGANVGDPAASTYYTAPANAAFFRRDYHLSSVPKMYQSLIWDTLGDSITSQGRWQWHIYIPELLVLTNLGVGGTLLSGRGDTAMVSDARVATLTANAAIVTIMGGTNDWVNNIVLGDSDSTDITEFNGALNVLITKLLTRVPKGKIIFQTPTYCENPSGVEFTENGSVNVIGLTIHDYANSIINRCNANGIKCIRLDDLWNHDNISTYVENDGAYLHPNDTGGALMGDYIDSEMNKIVNGIRG